MKSKTLLISLAVTLILAGCSTTSDQNPETKPPKADRVQVLMYDTTTRPRTTHLDIYDTKLPERPYKVIALLTCEGAVDQEVVMTKAILYRARQIGADGLLGTGTITTQKEGTVNVAGTVVKQIAMNVLGLGGSGARSVFRYRAIVYEDKYQLPNNNTTGKSSNIIEKLKAKAERGDAEAQYQLGCCYYTGDFGPKDYTEAIKWYQKAADQNFANIQFPLASAYVQRGVLERSKGDLEGALADFNKAIENRPDFTEIYVVRGTIKNDKGDLDGAVADYNKAIEMNPKLAIAYCARGLLNYNSHKFTDALADFRKSCELGLDVKTVNYSHCYIWFIRSRLGEQDAATKELQTYLDSRKTGTSDDWPAKVVRFIAGQLSEPDFFKAAENTDKKTNKEQHCEAYFYAGSKRLIEGDKTTANDYFEKCLATECKEIDEYNSAAAELKFLETSK